MANHPNKHIREAIRYAENREWSFAMSKGHLFGMLRCPHRGGCRHAVYSTPRNPEAHAKDIRRMVDRCPHAGDRAN